MAEQKAVSDVARELGVKAVDIMWWMKSADMRISKQSSKLNAAQEARIRDAHKRGQIERRDSAFTPAVLFAPYRPEPTLRYGRCTCCQLGFSYYPDDDYTDICDECEVHFQTPDEPQSRQLAREKSHAARYLTALQLSGAKTTEYEGRMKSAFRSRDLWKRMLVETVLAHEALPDGRCGCGSGQYPCIIRRYLENTNKGVYRQIEALEGLPEDEYLDMLYGRDRALMDLDPHVRDEEIG